MVRGTLKVGALGLYIGGRKFLSEILSSFVKFHCGFQWRTEDLIKIYVAVFWRKQFTVLTVNHFRENPRSQMFGRVLNKRLDSKIFSMSFTVNISDGELLVNLITANLVI